MIEVPLAFLLRLGRNKNDKHLGEPGLSYMHEDFGSARSRVHVRVCEEVARCRGHSLASSGMGNAMGESEVTAFVSFF